MDEWSHGDLFRLYVAPDRRARHLALINDAEPPTLAAAASRIKDLIMERVNR